MFVDIFRCFVRLTLGGKPPPIDKMCFNLTRAISHIGWPATHIYAWPLLWSPTISPFFEFSRPSATRNAFIKAGPPSPNTSSTSSSICSAVPWRQLLKPPAGHLLPPSSCACLRSVPNVAKLFVCFQINFLKSAPGVSPHYIRPNIEHQAVPSRTHKRKLLGNIFHEELCCRCFLDVLVMLALTAAAGFLYTATPEIITVNEER